MGVPPGEPLEESMKAFIVSLIVMVAVAAGASVVLNSQFQKSADEAYTTSGARIDRAH